MVKTIVQEALEVYSADKTGRYDFALESTGTWEACTVKSCRKRSHTQIPPLPGGGGGRGGCYSQIINEVQVHCSIIWYHAVLTLVVRRAHNVRIPRVASMSYRSRYRMISHDPLYLYLVNILAVTIFFFFFARVVGSTFECRGNYQVEAALKLKLHFRLAILEAAGTSRHCWRLNMAAQCHRCRPKFCRLVAIKGRWRALERSFWGLSMPFSSQAAPAKFCCTAFSMFWLAVVCTVLSAYRTFFPCSGGDVYVPGCTRTFDSGARIRLYNIPIMAAENSPRVIIRVRTASRSTLFCHLSSWRYMFNKCYL